MSRRIQARRGNGRFTRNTPENTFGLHLSMCGYCGQIHPWSLGCKEPESCKSCGRSLLNADPEAHIDALCAENPNI